MPFTSSMQKKSPVSGSTAAALACVNPVMKSERLDTIGLAPASVVYATTWLGPPFPCSATSRLPAGKSVEPGGT